MKSAEAKEELSRVRALLDPLVPLVEFRHRSWLEEDERADTLAFLESHGLAYVSVDAPPTRASNVLPPVAAATHRVAYVRFHGRNVKTWNIKAEKSSERFNWMYSPEELAEWVEKLARLTEDADEVYALFNNNRDDFAPRSALLLRGLLDEAGIPAAGGSSRLRSRRRCSSSLGRRVELDVSVLAETHSLEDRVEPLRAVGRREATRAGRARPSACARRRDSASRASKPTSSRSSAETGSPIHVTPPNPRARTVPSGARSGLRPHER